MADNEKVEEEGQDVEAHSAEVMAADALQSPDVLGHSSDALKSAEVMANEEEGDDVEAHSADALRNPDVL